MLCDKCRAEIPQGSQTTKFAVPSDFATKCDLMLAGELKEHERSFITDARGRRELTEKQKKWWSAIHKQCFGAWPDFSAPAPAPVATGQLDDETLAKVF